MLSVKPIHTGSDGNLYIINNNSIFYFIDCGIDYKIIIKTLFKLNILISDIKGCFISHRHKDHSLSIKQINKYMPVYSNNDVFNSFSCNGKVLKSYNKFILGELEIIPFNVEHGNIENYAYMFNDSKTGYKILFITDVFKFDEILKPKFDEIFIECNWTRDLMLGSLERTKGTPEYTKYERQYQTHMSLDSLKLILDKSIDLSNCKKITLIHPSQEVCDKELALNELRSIYPNIDIDFAKNII